MWQDFVCGVGGLQDWLLWEESRSCHMLGKNQFQLAAKGTHCWPKLSQWATLVAPLLRVYIYKTKKYCTTAVEREKWENVEKTLQTPRSVKKEWRRCCKHQSRSSPAACVEDYGEAGCPPAAHGLPWWSRFLCSSPWRRSLWRRWTCTEGGCSRWSTPAGADCRPDL